MTDTTPLSPELEACVEWLQKKFGDIMSTDFRTLLENLVEEVLDANQYKPPGVQRAIDRALAALAKPVPVSERLPEHIERALIKAECALSDIAEGEAEESEGDPLEWAEKRAADALARIRPVMRQHQIQTSEWPPLPAHALPMPGETKQ